MIPPRRSRVALAAAVLVAACGGSGGDRSTGPATWSASATPRLVIGEAEGEEAYLFQQIARVRLLPDGGVAVADRGLTAIRLFDAKGAFIREIGRSGEGPGEFGYISGMWLPASDTLEVYDSRLYRLSRYTLDGALASTLRFTLSGGAPELYLGRYANGDRAMAWIDQGPRDLAHVSPDVMHFGRFGADGTLRTLLGTGTGFRRFTRGPLPMSPRLKTAFVHDTLFFTDGYLPRLETLDGEGAGGAPVALPVHRVDEGAAYDALRAGLIARGDTNLLNDLPDIPRDTVPTLAELLTDDHGRFWVKQYEPATDAMWLGGWAGAPGGHWWVLERDGAVVAGLDLPNGFILMDVRDDALAGIARDELGVERVMVFGLDRGTP